MENFKGYSNVELISENSKTLIYRAFSLERSKSVILKVLSGEYASAFKIYLFNNEFEILSNFHSPYIVAPIELTTYNNLPIMVLEDIGGMSLKEYYRYRRNNSTFTIHEQLRLALKICEAVAEIHKCNFIHKDINPSNIIYNNQTDALQIIDFGLSTSLKSEQCDTSSVFTLQGTLAYISPEQTGRMNRMLDYRSDFYSLGVTLYELFSGMLPFTADSSREWVYCHVTKKHQSLGEIIPGFPSVISNIIDRLLEKNVENRYQSSYGIVTDFRLALLSYENEGEIQDFEIGLTDFSHAFELPQKLYGRKSEISQLFSAYEELSIWKSELVVIHGFSGIGKTSLVNELFKPVLANNGYFISGKFEEFKSSTPYYALIQAFSGFVQNILSERDEVIEKWRKIFLHELSENVQLIVDVIPDLEKIVGKQKQVGELSAIESQNRFVVSFLHFVQCIAKHTDSLVLFLDDVQSADLASIEMIKNILADANSMSIMIIVSYRSNEISRVQGFDAIYEKIQKAGVKIFNIALKELDIYHIEEFLQDVFTAKIKDIQELAALCFEKTHGNPFFLREFLQDLYQKEFIVLNEIKGEWSWNISLIRSAAITDNVAEILSQRIRSLAPASQKVLLQAACIGNRFDVETLASINKVPHREIILNLHDVLRAGFIQPTDYSYHELFLQTKNNSVYKFVHERILTSAYGLLTIEMKQKIHFDITNYLFSIFPEKDIDEHIFTVVEHCNKGIECFSKDMYSKLLSLNLLAAHKSKKTAAFSLSFQYLKIAQSFESSDFWKRDFKGALSLYTKLAEAAYLNGEYACMEEYSHIVFSQKPELLDLVSLYEIRILAFQAQHMQQLAIDEGFEFLAKLGYSFQKNAGVPSLVFDLLKLQLQLVRYSTSKLQELPHIQNQKVQAAMHIMGVLTHPLYDTNPTLFAIVIFKILKLTLRYGCAPISPLAFMMYGMLVNVMFGKIQKGYEYGQIGLHLLQRLNAKRYWAETSVCYNLGVRIWKEPFSESIEGLISDFKISLETGDIGFAISSLATCTNYQFFKGDSLHQITETAYTYKRSLAHIPYQKGMKVMDMQLQAVYNLQNSTENPEILIGEYFDEVSHLKEKETLSQVAGTYLLKMMLGLFLNNTKSAYQYAIEGRKYIQSLAGILHFAMFHVYESFIILAEYNKLSNTQQKQAKGRVHKNLRMIKKWAVSAPENFANKQTLIEAELARIQGDYKKASTLYDIAIDLAKEQRFTHEEALANELAARFWQEQYKTDFAAMYIFRAYKLYEIWGASVKIEALEKEFSSYIITHPDMPSAYHTQTLFESTSKESSQSTIIDIDTVMEAAKTISQEIVLSSLFEKILTIIIEHACAERGVLLLLDDANQKSMKVEAIGVLQGSQVSVTHVSQEIQENQLPLSVIRYVQRTQKPLILHNASQEGNFIRDVYIKLNNIKSVAVIPILHQSKLQGILYLENNHIEKVFHEQKTEVLTLLCTQAAISIENARLYDSLEHKVQERTREVIMQKEIIEAKNIEITDSIEYAKQIQAAILPRSAFFREEFKDFFILYKPKDIVSGDFYWFQTIDSNKILAVADCTGHGVPGGFMSMLGITLLNEIVVKNEILSPAEILNALRNEIIAALHQTGNFGEQRDGMDISLCIIDTKTMKMHFSGAFNSIFCMRSKQGEPISSECIAESKTHVLYELKADRMPISHYAVMNSFSEQSITLYPDDLIVLYSDGFQDQLGGEFDKKYMRSRFKKILVNNCNQPCKDIKRVLETEMEVWMNTSKFKQQLDDITIVGIRV